MHSLKNFVRMNLIFYLAFAPDLLGSPPKSSQNVTAKQFIWSQFSQFISMKTKIESYESKSTPKTKL